MATARQLPADVYPETLSRLPPVKRETLNEAQQKAYDALAAPRSGRLNLAGIKGPGGVILHMPKLAKSLGDVNRMLRSDPGLDDPQESLSIPARGTRAGLERGGQQAPPGDLHESGPRSLYVRVQGSTRDSA